MTATEAGALSKYRLIAELGRGGMADVYLALVSLPGDFNKLVVIKRIRGELAEDADFVKMFLDEARLAARLNHPNVIQTNEIGGEGRQLFLAMEYLEGQPLNRVASRLGRDRSLTWAMHLQILTEALTGLHYAHELRDFDGTRLDVVHRDVTPHNVFVSYTGQVKVVDFGIAKALGSAETRSGMLKGKASYMAPEQAIGDPVDRRADIFSVGVMIWEALVGDKLFREENEIAVLQRVVEGKIPDPRSRRPGVPARLAEICLRALAYNREQRYATAAELQAALEGALKEVGERPSLREVGRLVAERFERERAEINALVEERINIVRASTDLSVDLPLAQLDETLLRQLPVVNHLTQDAGRLSSPDARPSRVPSRASAPHGIEVARVEPRSSAPVVDVPPTSAPALPSSPKTSARKLWIAGFVASAVLGAALALVRARMEAPPRRAATPLTPPASSARLLHIESTPPGATVSEGDKTLGRTPLTLPLNRRETVDRTFVLTLSGYAPVTLVERPSRDDVRVVVPLRPSDSPDAVSATSAEPLPPSAKADDTAEVGRGKGGPAPKRTGGGAAERPPLPINMSR